MQERRKYVRTNGLVLVNYKAPEVDLDGKSSAYDISGGGLRITLEKKIEPGTALELEIYLPGSSQPIVAKGEVSWAQKSKEKVGAQIVQKKEYFFIGVKFTVIDEKNKSKIIDYVQRKSQQTK